jgi:hypothetical protein
MFFLLHFTDTLYTLRRCSTCCTCFLATWILSLTFYYYYSYRFLTQRKRVTMFCVSGSPLAAAGSVPWPLEMSSWSYQRFVSTVVVQVISIHCCKTGVSRNYSLLTREHPLNDTADKCRGARVSSCRGIVGQSTPGRSHQTSSRLPLQPGFQLWRVEVPAGVLSFEVLIWACDE